MARVHERSIREAIREAKQDPDPERLRESGADEKGKPEAVNLEREEPITNARRADTRPSKEPAKGTRELVPEEANPIAAPLGLERSPMENKPIDKKNQQDRERDTQNKGQQGSDVRSGQQGEGRSGQQGGQRSYSGGSEQGNVGSQGGQQNLGRSGSQGGQQNAGGQPGKDLQGERSGNKQSGSFKDSEETEKEE